MTIIKVDNVSYDYGGSKRPALSKVSLEIKEGEFLAIVGHNGSGKSTLAKLLNGLLLPSGGTVIVDGKNTADENLSLDIKRCVGMVFQNPDNQIVTTIVEDDVAFGPENLGIESAQIRKRVDAALKSVGMEDYALAAPHMLSGGQKQRIAIAGMLAMQPRVLVLDEATAMLDPKGRHDILAIAKRLNKEQGITIVMITQYMDEAISADRIIVMQGGSISFEGTPEKVFAQSRRLISAGLEEPPAVALRNELIKEGVLTPTPALSSEDIADAIYKEYIKRGVIQNAD